MTIVRREQRLEDVRKTLEEVARREWGDARMKAQGAALDATAEALWQIAQHPIPMQGEEPV